MDQKKPFIDFLTLVPKPPPLTKEQKYQLRQEKRSEKLWLIMKNKLKRGHKMSFN